MSLYNTEDSRFLGLRLRSVVWYIFTNVSENYSVIIRVRKSNKMTLQNLIKYLPVDTA
jgi:hypothetical protein